MQNKKFVIIATEGDTDELFYKNILKVLKSKIPDNKFKVDNIDYICVNGFGKFESKFISIYKKKYKEYKKIDKNCEVYVFLCYDNDVFDGKKYPPISWKKIERELFKNNAHCVHHIIADKSIEDFILFDFIGILKYLRLSNLDSRKYKGLEGLKKLFKQANKAYIKGTKCDKLLNTLDFKVIEKNICTHLSKLCEILGVQCCKIK